MSIKIDVIPYTRKDGLKSYALVGPDGVIHPVAQMVNFDFLVKHQSINTLRAKVFDLKQWFTFLHNEDLVWDRVTWKDDDVLARYVEWLRFGNQVSLNERILPLLPTAIRSEATIARHVSTLYSFYEHHYQTPFAQSIREFSSQELNRHSQGGFRHRGRKPVTISTPSYQDTGSLTRQEVDRLIDECTSYRDRLIISLLAERGLRVGQLLGLRHCDWDSRKSTYTIVPRNDNTNGARAKTDRTWVLPLTSRQVALYKDYMFEEYGDILSDYIFINKSGNTKDSPMTYHGIARLIKTLSQRTGISLHPHLLRHTFATLATAEGVPIGVIQVMMTHKDASTTTGTYVHIQAETIRSWLDNKSSRLKLPDDLQFEQASMLVNGRYTSRRRKDS